MRNTEVFRDMLANLRAVLGDRTAHSPYLHITRETVWFYHHDVDNPFV